MVCSPSSNQLNPPTLGPSPNIGFGPMFAPFNVAPPDISIPDGVPDDILELLQDIYALIPGGRLVPNADDSFRKIPDAIASVMNQLGPYLALYNFYQALLNMILCIIDVLCSLTVRAPAAIRRLFKRCLPDFLNLFPLTALLAMILALLLLLLALIEYLIELILAFIRDLIENLTILAEAIQFDDEQGTLAGIQKIASLLCLIEQAFALLIAFQAIFAIIKALADLAGRTVCSKGNRRGNDGDCCPDEVCPPFIAESPDGLFGTLGRLIYHRTILQDSAGFGFTLPNIRNQRWQFVDDETGLQFTFGDIITPINGNIYWPSPLEYQKDSNLRKVPYTLDMRLFVDPATFNHNVDSDEFSGPRYFRINNIIVKSQPYFGVLDFNNQAVISGNIGNNTGTLNLIGGLVFEDDGITPVVVNGVQLSLDTFIVQDSTTLNPVFEDGYQISNISYNLKINHAELYNSQIITLGCLPEIAHETNTLNDQLVTDSVFARIGALPDIDGALNCLNQSLSNFRKNVSPENAAIFESEIVGCLNSLKEQTETTYKNALSEGTSIFESDVEIDPNIQFLNEAIKVKVTLKDSNGTVISFNIPENVRGEIASQLGATASLGVVSDFEFDGESAFVADLVSDTAGDGELKVNFNGSVFSRVINRDDDDLPTAIEERVFEYKFVGTGFKASAGDDDVKERRDESDVSQGGV